MKQLTKRQRTALELMFNGMNATDTSKEIGVTRQTIQSWKKTPQWRDGWDKLKPFQIDEASARSFTFLDNVVKKYQKTLDESENLKTVPQAVIEAAKTLVRYGYQEMPTRTENKNLNVNTEIQVGYARDVESTDKSIN